MSFAPLAESASRTLHLDRDLRDVLVRGDKLLVSSFRRADLLLVGDSGIDQRLRPPVMQAALNMVGGKPLPPGAMVGGIEAAKSSAGVAWRIVPGPGTQALMLHQRGTDGEVGTQPNAYTPGPGCAGIVESTVSSLDQGETGASVRSGGALSNAVLAVDLALSPDGQQIAVVSAGHGGTDQQVLFYSTEEATDAAQPGQALRARGTAPGTMVTPPDAGVDDYPDGGVGTEADGGAPIEEPIEYRPPNGEIIAVAYDPRGNILVQSREPATLQILTQRAAPIVLSAQRRSDPGHQLFHGATSGKLACASCHPEGGEDGRTWKFVGLGARRTQSLRGGIMDTAPFHWNGDMPSLDHLMHDVFQGRMAGAKVDRVRLAALGTWLDQVGNIKPSAWHEQSAVLRGKALFESPVTACTTCHKGADFTNGGSFDVGTGGTFQVPQLHNLAFRAPFLHDGCATTLLERFTKCGQGDRHGITSTLTMPQITDLIAYLESL